MRSAHSCRLQIQLRMDRGERLVDSLRALARQHATPEQAVIGEDFEMIRGWLAVYPHERLVGHTHHSDQTYAETNAHQGPPLSDLVAPWSAQAMVPHFRGSCACLNPMGRECCYEPSAADVDSPSAGDCSCDCVARHAFSAASISSAVASRSPFTTMTARAWSPTLMTVVSSSAPSSFSSCTMRSGRRLSSRSSSAGALAPP